MSAYTGIAILFLIVFLSGIMFGIFVIVSWASNREDKKKSLKGPPPGTGCGGTRRLVGFSRRARERQPPSEDPLPQRVGEEPPR
jgi:hypothetical protein